MAPTLWEYDAFGNRTKETWKLADPATVSNSRITTWSYGAEQAEDGVYRVVTATRNNGQGTTYDETQKELISSLSSTLESKTIATDPRGNISTQWSEYGAGALRTQKERRSHLGYHGDYSRSRRIHHKFDRLRRTNEYGIPNVYRSGNRLHQYGRTG